MRKLTLVIVLLLASSAAFADGSGYPPLPGSARATTTSSSGMTVGSAVGIWLSTVR